MAPIVPGSLADLATRAGLEVSWTDASGIRREVEPDTLRTLLGTLGLPCGKPAELRASIATLEAETHGPNLPPLITAEVDRAIALPVRRLKGGTRYKIELEQGGIIEGLVSAPKDAAALLAPIAEPGYHTLWLNDRRCRLAVAPRRCFAVADADAALRPSTARSAASLVGRMADPSVDSRTDPSGSPSAGQASPGPGEPAPRWWGVAAQLYGLRRPGDGGVGDYTALVELARASAARGAHALAISPVHAMFAANPGNFSPYSPSSRLFLNVLHIDPAATFGAQRYRAAVDALGLADESGRLEALELIDWPAVSATRLAILRRLFDGFIASIPELPARPGAPLGAAVAVVVNEADSAAASATGRGSHIATAAVMADAAANASANTATNAAAGTVAATPDTYRPAPAGDDAALARDFAAFRAHGGQPLEDHARFEALHAALLAEAPANGHWRNWPAALQDPRGAAVEQFAASHAGEIAFHLFLQWLATRGLAAAQQAARDAGMGLGLVADLAVGCDSAGSHSWSYKREMLQGASVGAPPDLFNPGGQAWGLTTFSPRAMRSQGFGAFIDMLRAAFAHAGGIRVDHILGLRRLWLVPDGEPASAGAYLHYPLEDLLRLIALESWRHRAVVIGEDLGTVPEGIRERMAASALLGIRVLWFEQDEHGFIPPEQWDEPVSATTTTHDLPTVAGWWSGADIEWRARVGQLSGGTAQAHAARAAERTALWSALRSAGLVGLATSKVPPPQAGAAPLREALAYVAQTRAPLVTYPLEDLLGLVEQPNLPGSTDEHPNWRRRMPEPTEALFTTPRTAALLSMIGELRPGRHGTGEAPATAGAAPPLGAALSHSPSGPVAGTPSRFGKRS
jgi:4-alpha-glucanotransferase